MNRNNHIDNEIKNDADIYNASQQESPHAAIHMDNLEDQETITENRDNSPVVEMNNNPKGLDYTVEIPIESKAVGKCDTQKDTVIDLCDATENMVSRKHPMLVNFLSNQMQRNQGYNNGLPMPNQQEPQKSSWPDQYGRQYPEGFDGPLVYTPETRNHFVRLVLSIVLIMLIATSGFIAYVWTTPDVKQFFQMNRWSLILPALIGFMMIDYAMVCSPCSRRMPCNVILLFLTVVCMSVLASKITVRYELNVMLYASLSTAAVVLVCCLLACSNFDFTSWMLYLVVIGTAFSTVALIVLVVMAFGTVIKPVVIAILAIGTLIQVVALTIQLQMILGGKSIELSDEDYALGAFMIYASIVDIFMKMVQIIGLSGN